MTLVTNWWSLLIRGLLAIIVGLWLHSRFPESLSERSSSCSARTHCWMAYSESSAPCEPRELTTAGDGSFWKELPEL